MKLTTSQQYYYLPTPYSFPSCFNTCRDNKRKVCALCTYFQYINAAAAAKSRQSCLTLCDPIDGSPPGSRPWDSPGKNTGVGSPAAAAAKSLQSCPTLCNPTDSSPPGSPVPGILQARTLEWVAIFFSNA